MPASRQQIVDLQFIEIRHQLIEVAAFLDRVDRLQGADDHRLAAMRRALPLLLEDRPDRAKAILEVFSDHSPDPVPVAVTQGACGAPATDH
jgi:hypothetical protein